jgi:hypothetical protein
VRVAELEELPCAAGPVLSSARGLYCGHGVHTKGLSWLRRLTLVEKHLRIIAMAYEASD